MAALLTLALLPADAPAAGQFSITPARRSIVGRPPVTLGTTSVGNTTAKTFQVKVFPVFLSQRLDGSFALSEGPLDVRRAGLVVSVGPTKFDLTPGARQEVKLRWEGLPKGTKAAAVGVIFEGVPKINGSPQIGEIDRLVAVNFLRLPGKFDSSGKFTGLRGEQTGPRALQFLPKVENTGEVVTTPRRTRFLIRDDGGKTVFQSKWVADIVLPGAEREFPIPIDRLLQAGTYTAVATMDFGRSLNQKISEPFTLVGPNTLPSPKVDVTDFSARDVLGQPVNVTGVVRSLGTAPVSTDVSVTLVRITNGQPEDKPLGSKRVPYKDLAPKSERPLALTFPSVPPGNYRVTARYRDESGELQTLTSDFQPVPPAKKSGGGFPAAIAIGGLGVVAASGLVFFFWRRRRKDDEDQDDEPADGAGSAVVSPGPSGVDLNAAGLNELTTLPGVGPRAAQRIIDHREEYGPFASLDDLAAVEGFGDKRIDGLRDRVRF